MGRDDFLDLSAEADVIVENFTPGTMEKLGIDYETVAERNPAVIYCSITGFGQARTRVTLRWTSSLKRCRAT